MSAHHSTFAALRGPEATAQYRHVHYRLRRVRGPASEYPCARCGRQAANWAYNYTCPDEVWSPLGPFCPTAEHYMAVDRRCHSALDGNGQTARERWARFMAELVAA